MKREIANIDYLSKHVQELQEPQCVSTIKRKEPVPEFRGPSTYRDVEDKGQSSTHQHHRSAEAYPWLDSIYFSTASSLPRAPCFAVPSQQAHHKPARERIAQQLASEDSQSALSCADVSLVGPRDHSHVSAPTELRSEYSRNGYPSMVFVCRKSLHAYACCYYCCYCCSSDARTAFAALAGRTDLAGM